MDERKRAIMMVDSRPVQRERVEKMFEDTHGIKETGSEENATLQLTQAGPMDAVPLGSLMHGSRTVGFPDHIRRSGCVFVPAIITLEDSGEERGLEALDHGARDYAIGPIRPKALKNRLNHALLSHRIPLSPRSPPGSEFSPYSTSLHKEFCYMKGRNRLTELYNREKMFTETRRMIDRYIGILFVFLCFDIDRFRLYNAMSGRKREDKPFLLLTDTIEGIVRLFESCTYGRVNADIFRIYEPYDCEKLDMQVQMVKGELTGFEKDYLLRPMVGAYIAEESDLAVEEMYMRAFMGSKKYKNKSVSYLGFYDMGEGTREAEGTAIISNMQTAMDEEQLVVYSQPKFDTTNERDVGVEALVGWEHPDTGLLSSKYSILVFERNGFISRLDYYVWEHVCRLIHKWLQDGTSLYPITVNIPRISLYNPKLLCILLELIRRYDMSTGLLNLGITENAYVSGPETIQEAVRRLHQTGLILSMDGFGSGYPSLNIPKDTEVDVLKTDMQFLSGGIPPGKGEVVLGPVIQTASNLGMPVVMGGVKTQEQKRSLYKIDCNYVQGFYHVRLMPQEEHKTKYVYRKKEVKGWSGGQKGENTGGRNTMKNARTEYLDFVIEDTLALGMARFPVMILDQDKLNRVLYAYYVQLGILLVAIAPSVAFAADGYSNILHRRYLKEMIAMSRQMTITFAVEVTCLFAFQLSGLFSRVVFSAIFVLSILSAYGERLLVKGFLKRKYQKIKYARTIIVIATKQQAEVLIGRLSARGLSVFRIQGLTVTGRNMEGERIQGITVSCSMSEVTDYVTGHIVDEVLSSIPDNPQRESELADQFLSIGMVTHAYIEQFLQDVSRKILEKICDINVVACYNWEAPPRSLFCKRMLDIVGSLMGAVMAFRVGLVIGSTIYMRSPGPVLLSQTRVGENDRKFRLYRFRSMVIDAKQQKEGPVAHSKIRRSMFKIDDDPRTILGIDRFIRRTSLDEFSQFLNVPKEDTSLVRTRPPTVDEYESYGFAHRKRLTMKPEIAGLWQTNGRSDITDLEQAVKLDSRYIDQRNLEMDLKITFRTIPVMLEQKGSVWQRI